MRFLPHLDGPLSELTLVATGVEVARALDAAEILAGEGIDARVVNLSTVKPLDEALLLRCARETGCFVTAEDHALQGGVGAAVASFLARAHPCPVEMIGVDDRFGCSGDPHALAEHFGLTGPFLARAARRALARRQRRDPRRAD